MQGSWIDIEKVTTLMDIYIKYIDKYREMGYNDGMISSKVKFVCFKI